MPMPTALPLRPLVLCLVLLFATAVANAATITASVTDKTGKPIANTPVTLSDDQGHAATTVKTNAAGVAVFANVAAGRYTLSAVPTKGAAVEQSVSVAAADTPTVELTAAAVVALNP